MFKTIENRCVYHPMLLSTRTDSESVRNNKNTQIRNAIVCTPFYCAFVAQTWKQEEMEKRLTRLICSRQNCSSIRSLILAFTETAFYFPYVEQTGNYRLASKARSEEALTMQDRREFYYTHPNITELIYWI